MNVVQTGTGLRYQIHEDGDGVLIKEGDIVTLEYEIGLLNGDMIYSSENDGVKTFMVGRGGVESGLEEAILKMYQVIGKELKGNDSFPVYIPKFHKV